MKIVANSHIDISCLFAFMAPEGTWEKSLEAVVELGIDYCMFIKLRKCNFLNSHSFVVIIVLCVERFDAVLGVSNVELTSENIVVCS